MARRIEIELTSDRGDGTWTWRAAGARQPKGTLDSTLLPPATNVGDVLRAEVEGFLDGLSIVAVLPPKDARPEPERIELLAPRSEGPLVTSRVSRSPRGRSDRDRDRPRRDRGDRDRDRGEGRGRRERGEGDRERGRSDDRRRERGERQTRPSTPPPPSKPKPKRLRPGKKHRTALLESLPAEQQPIAEQLLQGGIPSVRQAIEKQNEELKAAGKSQVSPEPLLDIAERLRNRAQAAVWRDRADAALAHIDDLDLRDLRSVVNAAGDGGRDEEARGVADQLREALLMRVEKEQAAWIAEVAENLQEGRVVRALRLSSRPPKAGQPLPADLSNQLVAATGAALTADTVAQRWATVLDALAYSPIRRRVLPESLPAKLSAELRTLIARLADRLPEIAHIFDIEPQKTPPSERPRQNRRKASPAKRAPKAQKSERKPKRDAEAVEKPPSEDEPQPAATDEAPTEAPADDATTAEAPTEATTDAPTTEAATEPTADDAATEATATDAPTDEATTEATADETAAVDEAETPADEPASDAPADESDIGEGDGAEAEAVESRS